MPDFTRRTHIVRITKDAKPGDPPGDTYIDVEVLDAIAFRYENGKEMILNCPASNAQTYIVDDTGGGHGQTPSGATRRSHMKRITGDDPKQMLDVEVIDFMAFRDQNGEEWILDMNSTNGDPGVFNTTDDSGSRSSTRRTHNEKIAKDRTDKNPTDFLTVERCDAMSFRTINGKEMVISCPSNDDPNSSDPRASTHIWSPEGYDPNDDSGPTPPDASGDSSIYLAFVNSADGFWTGKAKISQGPFWWIRKVSGGGGFIEIQMTANVVVNGSANPPPPPKFELDLGDPKKQPMAKLIDTKVDNKSDVQQVLSATYYFIWNDIVPHPTPSTYNVQCFSNEPGISFNYSQQWALKDYTTTGQLPGTGSSMPTGWWGTFADAAAYANAYNSAYAGQHITDYYTPTGGVILDNNVDPAVVYPTSVTVPASSAISQTTGNTRYLLSIPSAETTITVKVSNLGPQDTCAVYCLGVSDAKTKPKKVGDISFGGLVEPDASVSPDVVYADNLGTTTFTIKTKVIPVVPPNPAKPHHAQIIVSGGRPPHGLL